MKHKLKLWRLGLLATLSLALPQQTGSQSLPGGGATNYFVALNGKDTWSGQLAAPDGNGKDGPYATLERARNVIRNLKQLGPLPTGELRVWLRDGVYLRDTPFQLTSGDSGTPSSPIVYCAYPNEKPCLAGGRNVIGLQAVSDPKILARLSPSAQANVLQADLWGQGITNLGVLSRHGYAITWSSGQTELFFQGHPMQLARWPNAGWLNIGSVPVPGTNSFTYPGNGPSTWADLSDVWVHGYWKHDWADSCEKVASVNLSNQVVAIASPGSAFGYMPGQRFYFFNVLEELDSPGEYYIDRNHGLLYFWPPDTVTNGPVLISTADQIVTLTSVSNLAFAGITFEAARLTLISINGGQSNVITGCTLRGSSRDGVSISSSPGSGVASCDISEMGEMGASIIGTWDRTRLQSTSSFVQNSTIHQVGRLSSTYKPAVYVAGVGLYVGHNLIHDAPHCAIEVYGNDHVFEYNEIHHVVTETGDAGAVYMGQDWTMRGNVFRYNYLHNINRGGGVTGGGVVGIYLDDYFSGTTIFGNILCSVDGGVVIGGGRDNLVQNNIFVGSADYAISADQRGLSWDNGVTNSNSTEMKALKSVPYQTPPWSTRYPALVPILTNNPAAALGNVIQQNISYNNTTWLKLADNVASVLSVSNNLTTQDPLFLNYAQRQFGLQTNSPAWALGFQAIPMNTVGPTLLPAQGLRVYQSK